GLSLPRQLWVSLTSRTSVFVARYDGKGQAPLLGVDGFVVSRAAYAPSLLQLLQLPAQACECFCPHDHACVCPRVPRLIYSSPGIIAIRDTPPEMFGGESPFPKASVRLGRGSDPGGPVGRLRRVLQHRASVIDFLKSYLR